MFYLNSVNLQEKFKISSGIQTTKFYNTVFKKIKESGQMGRMGTDEGSAAKQQAPDGGSAERGQAGTVLWAAPSPTRPTRSPPPSTAPAAVTVVDKGICWRATGQTKGVSRTVE